MAHLQKSLLRISELIALFRLSIENDIAMGLFDKNRLAEDILVPIFREIYSYKKLINLNPKGGNFPGIDLGDSAAKVAFQITSDTSSEKIKDTLKKFVAHKHYRHYKHLIVYSITKKQPNHLGRDRDTIIGKKFKFSKDNDIRDYTDLLDTIKQLPLRKIAKIEAILEEQFEESKKIPTKKLVADHTQQQLAKEKNAKKYIPDIFIEVADIKDQARYFSLPTTFFQKTIDEIDRLDFEETNYILEKVSLPKLVFNAPKLLSKDLTLEDHRYKSDVLIASLTQIKDALKPYTSVHSYDFVDEKVPERKKYIYKEMKYRLENTSYFLTRSIDDIIDNIKLISSRVLLITSRAGQGKTNFVCDFADTVLLKRGIPCLFFTGRDFNHVAPEKIGEYFLYSIFGHSLNNLDDAFDKLQELAGDLDSPIVIIIDGINEHKNIKDFSHHLEKFIERALNHKSIKFILTCRSEYFEERFSNLKTSSFSDNIVYVKNLETRMDKKHKEQLLKGYFRFFNIRVGYLSKRARDILENDVLLLRMFCEVYGNVDRDKVSSPVQISDIYREKVFREYLERKLRDAIVHDSNDPQVAIRIGDKYRQALKHIIELMIEQKQYANILISDISAEHDEAITGLLGEDVIIRKDLFNNGDVLSTSTEVLNFTFDEFRDFLIANYLVNNVFAKNKKKFEEFIDSASSEKSVIAEGLRTYLFYSSRHPEGRGVILDFIRKKDWYQEIFIKSIFSVEEELITDEDINEVRKKFCDNERTASWILRMLVWRWRVSLYTKLNINLLFEILDTIDVELYKKLVVPGLSGYGVHGVDGSNSWQINQLTKDVEEDLDDKKFKITADYLNIMELLIYLFPVWGTQSSSTLTPAFNAYWKFAHRFPDKATTLLLKHIFIENLNIRSQVWRMLTGISNLKPPPISLVNDSLPYMSWYLWQAKKEDGLKV
ncbi:MAG: hypothetical protein FJZ86_12150 [Chloroflexi bacterium]|nr:hypothetical protein [Chloroflexota bacterium]